MTRATAQSSAWHSRRAWTILILSTLLGLVADLASKWAAFQHVADDPVFVERAEVLRHVNPSDLIPAHPPVTVIPGYLNFTLVLNPGAVFGIGAGQRLVFIVFTVFAIGFALLLFRTWTTAREWLAHVAIGLLISGGLGNLYDRVVYGCVRDFIHPLPGRLLPNGWSYPWGGREVWPYVSNVADALLIVGVLVLVVKSLRVPESQRTAGKSGPKPRTR